MVPASGTSEASAVAGTTGGANYLSRHRRRPPASEEIGVAFSDIYLYRGARGDADALAALDRQHHHGLLRWPPFGRLQCLLPAGYSEARPSGICNAYCLQVTQRLALRASAMLTACRLLRGSLEGRE